MTLRTGETIADLVGATDLLRIPSLSDLSACEIFVKCEFQNPGGSIKDRAALQMVQDALARGDLKPGMTIVEGTAGNTGIGLALVAKSFGLDCLVVMPKGQTPEKERMIALFGAELKLVDPCPFSNPNHFYHTARRIAEENPTKYWWANQFENLSNFKTHHENTSAEIWQQMAGRIDTLVSVAGTGGTIAGTSVGLKERNPNLKVVLIDPEGSGLCSYVKTGEFKSSGSSFTEGIGIMRLVANFKKSMVDEAFTIPDRDLVTISRYVRDRDGLVLGSSSALNLAGAFFVALKAGSGKRLVTFACDLGERSYSKLYSPEFLSRSGIDPKEQSIDELLVKYQNS